MDAVAARLLTASEVAGVTTIEVSHRALISKWSRLAAWLREARDDIHLQQVISQDAAAWERQRDRLIGSTAVPIEKRHVAGQSAICRGV